MIHLYGVLIAAAILAAAVYCGAEEKRRGLPKDTGLDIILYAVPLAVLAARVYYVVFSWRMYRDNPLSVFYIWEGGLAIYGGVIGGMLGLWLLAKKRNIPFMTLGDIAAPALLMGQAIGRWGNFVNGEAHGNAVINAALQFFPMAVRVEGVWYYATFFYESLWNLLGFWFLYRLGRKEGARRGRVTLWYFVWYGAGRMMIEMLRTDSLMLGAVRVSQALSLLLFAASSLMLAGRGKAARWVYACGGAGLLVCIAAILLQNTALMAAGTAVCLAYACMVYRAEESERRNMKCGR